MKKHEKKAEEKEEKNRNKKSTLLDIDYIKVRKSEEESPEKQTKYTDP